MTELTNNSSISNNINLSIVCLDKILNNVLLNNIYENEFGDVDLIFKEFKETFENYSINDKIKILCHNENLSKEDICVCLSEDNSNTIQTNLKRLNHSCDIKQIGSKPFKYSTEIKGKAVCNMLFSSFIRSSEYINFQKKNKINPDNKQLLQEIHKFLDEENYSKIIRQLEHNEKKFIEIPYSDICLNSVKLGDFLGDKPKECIDLIEIVIKGIYGYDVSVCLIDFPNSEKLKIGSQRVKDIGGLFEFEGIIKRKSRINPKLTHLEYLCTNPDCAYSTERLILPQTEDKKKTLKACPRCKAPIDIVKENLTDVMGILIETDFIDVTDIKEEIKNIELEVKGGLLNHSKVRLYNVGEKIKVIGFVSKKNLNSKGQVESTDFKYYIDVNNIIADKTEESIDLSNQDIKEIKEFAKKGNVLENIKNNFIIEAKGLDEIKISMILQAVGATNGKDSVRKDIHIILVGDPGQGKTLLANNFSKFLPKFIYTTGTNSSKAGLTGACVRDEFSGEWVVEAGSLPKANGGVIFIDEFDKLPDEDKKGLNDSFESQVIRINKAVSAEFETKCSVFACANPKNGQFDEVKPIVSQINMDPTLFSRFDLKFIMVDKGEQNKDKDICEHILKSQCEDEEKNEEEKSEIISPLFIKKYLFYCKYNVSPLLTSKNISLIQKYYLNLRKQYRETNYKINIREINTIMRLAIANTKLNLRNLVSTEDIMFAINLHNDNLMNLGVGFQKLLFQEEYKIIENEIIDLLKYDKATKIESILKQLDHDEKQITEKIKKLKSKGLIVEYVKGEYKKL